MRAAMDDEADGKTRRPVRQTIDDVAANPREDPSGTSSASDGLPLGGSPAASRRLRLGNNTPRQRAVARRFAHTPRGYRAGTASRGGAGRHRVVGRAVHEPSPSVARACRTFDTRSWPAISSRATNTRRRALWRSARLRASRSRSFRVQGWMERITDSPDGQTDVSAQEATSRQGAWVPRPHEDGG